MIAMIIGVGIFGDFLSNLSESGPENLTQLTNVAKIEEKLEKIKNK